MTPAVSTLAERMATCLAGHGPGDEWSSRLGWDAPTGEAGEPWADLLALGDDDAARWLDLEMICEQARGMDARAAAAYLVGRLGHALSVWLVRLHQAGFVLRPGSCVGICARPRLVAWSQGDQQGVAPVFDLLIEPSLAVLAGRDDPRAVGDAVAMLMRPLIAAVHDRSGLAAAALWRLVADGVTGAFLEDGKAQDASGRAMADARAAIAAPSPLWNRQVGFVEMRLPANFASGRQERCEWFRVRGGCCRYHTLEGGEHCSTCVHRDPQSRETRLLDLMREKVIP